VRVEIGISTPNKNNLDKENGVKPIKIVNFIKKSLRNLLRELDGRSGKGFNCGILFERFMVVRALGQKFFELILVNLDLFFDIFLVTLALLKV